MSFNFKILNLSLRYTGSVYFLHAAHILGVLLDFRKKYFEAVLLNFDEIIAMMLFRIWHLHPEKCKHLSKLSTNHLALIHNDFGFRDIIHHEKYLIMWH